MAGVLAGALAGTFTDVLAGISTRDGRGLRCRSLDACDEVGRGIRTLIAMLDEQPLRLGRVVAPRSDQYPGSAESLTVKDDLEIAALVAVPDGRRRIFVRDDGLVGAAIPDHDRPAAVFPGRDRAFELVVFDRVVLNLHRQSPHPRIE